MSLIQLSSTRDSIFWRLESNDSFTTSYVMKDMQSPIASSSSTELYRVIWKDSYPEKIKFFRWETCLLPLNTHDKLQRGMPYMQLSPYWCALCKNHRDLLVTFLSHVITLMGFGTKSSPSLDGQLLSLLICPLFLASTLIGHPFKNEKEVYLATFYTGYTFDCFVGKKLEDFPS